MVEFQQIWKRIFLRQQIENGQILFDLEKNTSQINYKPYIYIFRNQI
ncbi:hypothetical protein pb186bvf_014819 [Paramecium bursaria]